MCSLAAADTGPMSQPRNRLRARLVATTDRVFAMVTDKGPVAWRMRLNPFIAPLLFRLTAIRRFAPLRSVSWQVHIYGEPHPGAADVCAELELPLHVLAWHPEMTPPGLTRGGLYLIRPDGYIAIAAVDGDPGRLRKYLGTLRYQERGLANGASC